MKNKIAHIANLKSTIRLQIEQLKIQYGICDLGTVNISSPDHLEYLSKSREASEMLFLYLQTLSDNDLSRLVTLMYAGKKPAMVTKVGGFNQFHQFIKNQGFTTRNICIETICEREVNLNEYYQDALALANSMNFDINSDFV